MATHTPTRIFCATRLCLQLLVNFGLRLTFLTLGGFFALLTSRVLLWEVHGLNDLTIEHYLTIGAMVGAITTGIFFWNMLWDRKFLVAIGLGIGFLSATAYCLIGSAGRSDEVAFERNAVARQINNDRERAQRNRDEAQRRYDAALVAETAECGSGQGRSCLGKRAVTEDRRTDFEVAERLLQQAKPEQRENGKLKRAAQVIALFSNVPEDRAERGLVIIWPFLPPFICELLTITFLHLGFACRRVARTVPKHNPVPPLTIPPPVTVTATVPTAPATVAETLEAGWEPMSVEHARELAAEARATAVFDALRQAGRPVCNDELAGLIKTSKAESSRRSSSLADIGLIQKHRQGRYVAISLRPLH